MTAVETSSKNLRDTWTTERVAQLKSGVSAGLSCAQIANEIGVSRNAVIGKINRLGLSRGRNPATPRPRSGAAIRRPQILTQRLLLKSLFASAPTVDKVVSSEPCSLLDLAPRKCRWPIGGNGIVELTFCGNATVEGMSYCAGHARMAYRGSERHQGTSRAAACEAGKI
ncbi:MAG TPA: GcrA family cell cycle regulator [Pseudolabrys sp.]|nr:GcrA family cell cycle regulator [Pseudolabrys sp.]